jgi:hypothetical protein
MWTPGEGLPGPDPGHHLSRLLQHHRQDGHLGEARRGLEKRYRRPVSGDCFSRQDREPDHRRKQGARPLLPPLGGPSQLTGNPSRTRHSQ